MLATGLGAGLSGLGLGLLLCWGTYGRGMSKNELLGAAIIIIAWVCIHAVGFMSGVVWYYRAHEVDLRAVEELKTRDGAIYDYIKRVGVETMISIYGDRGYEALRKLHAE